jgi:hypothetical protein
MRRSIVEWIIAVMALIWIQECFAMRPMDVLEIYDLSELTYMDMHSEKCGSRKIDRASILDPEGLPYAVKVGNQIGKNFGFISQITTRHIKILEVYQNDAGEWIERTVLLPRSANAYPRARYGYEQDHALRMLGERDAIGKQLQGQLIKCRNLFREDAKRLACFDEAVGYSNH